MAALLSHHRVRTTKRCGLRLESLEPRQMLDAAAGLEPGMADSPFASAAELSQFLLDDALKQYESLFGQQTYGWPWYYRGGPVMMAGDGMVAANNNDHSETNTQVAGVDEADIVETDGDYLFVLGSGGVAIIDALPANEMKVASRVAIDGTPFGEFLFEDRLAVLSYVSPRYDVYPATGGAIDVMVGNAMIWPGTIYRSQLQLTLIDVSDRSAPKLVSETRIDGSYTDARAVGDTLYLISSDTFGLPAPQTICTPNDDPDKPEDPAPVDAAGNVVADRMIWWPTENCVYETREAYVARVTGHELELGLPQMTSSTGGLANPAASNSSAGTVGGMNGGTTAGSTSTSSNAGVTITGPLSAATNIYRPVSTYDRNLVSITSYDLSSNEPGSMASTSVPTTTTTEVYASLSSIYLANPDWGANWSDGTATSLLKFDFAANGRVDLSARGHVRGGLLNQFSIDEYDGSLRIATTQGWGVDSRNAVYVLEQNGRHLDIVGSIVGLAPGERIFAARFMGDEGYVVTFRQTDPLFALDLSDPTAPKVAGELHIPGFSNYLQAANDSKLIGIGRNADATGRAQELQVSLFDVGDLSHPQLAGRYGIDVGAWSWSEATTDHHAVGFYPGYDVLAIPITNGGGWEWLDRDGDGTREFYSYRPHTELWVFKLNLYPTFAPVDAIELLGKVEHEGHIRRSVRIYDVLYAISENVVTAHAILNPERVLGRVHFGQEDVGIPLVPSATNDPIVALATQSPETTAPVVTAASAGGSTWSPAVVNYLESAAGSNAPNNSTGAATSVSWNNVNQIKLSFSEDVAVAQTDLTVAGVNRAAYTVNGFAYDAGSRTAIWTLAEVLTADEVTVTLADNATDMAGNRLDGDRDGVAGGRFKFTFSSLAGDVNRDGVVDASDLAATLRNSFTSVDGGGFDLASDVNGDGAVSYLDAITVRNQLGSQLPASTTPQAPASLVVATPTASRPAVRTARRPAATPTDNAEPTTSLGATRRSRLSAPSVDQVLATNPEGATPQGKGSLSAPRIRRIT